MAVVFHWVQKYQLNFEYSKEKFFFKKIDPKASFKKKRI